jgi:hypothetical protein
VRKSQKQEVLTSGMGIRISLMGNVESLPVAAYIEEFQQRLRA